MSVLVIAEHRHGQVDSATLAALTAAQALGENIEVLVAGSECESVAKTLAQIDGVSKVLQCDASHYAQPMAEDMANLISAQASNKTHLVMAATTLGKNIMPRVAAQLDVAQVSDLIEIVSKDTFKRLIYAGSVLETVQALDAIKVLTVRASAFDLATSGASSASIDSITPLDPSGLSECLQEEVMLSNRPSLSVAKIIISGGRGLKNSENFQVLEGLADRLGAAVGASRAAVDAGFVSNDYQVGQTGKIVAPDIYIAIGISGAVQHLAGIKDAKVIVAINKDPDAPIFDVADFGLVGDFFALLPELEQKLDELGYPKK